MLTFLIAVGAVALMMLGLSITLMRKGHNIEGDVGDNREMKKLGLKCTIEEMSGGHDECPAAGEQCCSHCDIECGISK